MLVAEYVRGYGSRYVEYRFVPATTISCSTMPDGRTSRMPIGMPTSMSPSSVSCWPRGSPAFTCHAPSMKPSSFVFAVTLFGLPAVMNTYFDTGSMFFVSHGTPSGTIFVSVNVATVFV